MSNETTGTEKENVKEELVRIQQYYERTLSYYSSQDAEASLWMARKTAEAMCRQIFERDVSANSDPTTTLDKFIDLLNKQNVLPRYVIIPLRTIQSYGNYGTHDQGRESDVITTEYVQPCLHALASIVEWYHREYHQQQDIVFLKRMLQNTLALKRQVLETSPKEETPQSWSGNKPVKQIVWEAVQEITQGDIERIFSPKEVIQVILTTYPDGNKSTIRCQLIADCVNHTSRKHYPGGKDRYWLVEKGKFRLLDPLKDTTNIDKANEERKRTRWDEETFFLELEKNAPEQITIARRIYQWTREKMPEIWWGKGSKMGSYIPGFTHRERWHQIIGLWTYGVVELQFQYLKKSPPFDNESKRKQLLEKFNTALHFDLENIHINLRPSVPLKAIEDEDVLNKFFEVVEWFIHEVKHYRDGDIETKEPVESQYTVTQIQYMNFYTDLVARIKQQIDREYHHPTTRSYYQIQTGIACVHFEWAFHGQPRSHFGVELHFEKSKKATNVSMFEHFENMQDALENSLGEHVTYQKNWGKKWCRLFMDKQGGEMTEELKVWAVEKMVALMEIVQPELESIKKVSV